MSGTGKIRIPRKGDGALAVVEFLSEVTAFTEMLTVMIEKYNREVINDSVCGSWVAREGNRSLLIRKSMRGYQATLCDTSRLYKVFEREFDIVTYRGGLRIAEHGMTLQGESVSLNGRFDELSFGSYGIFDA